MKRLLLAVIAAALLFSFMGCSEKSSGIVQEIDMGQSDDSEDTQIVDEDFAKSAQESAQEWNQSDLSQEQIDSIDWNTEAYLTYFQVIDDTGTFYYWNSTTGIGVLDKGYYVYTNNGTTLILDPISKDIVDNDDTLFSDVLPTPDSITFEIPIIPEEESDDVMYVLIKNETDGYYHLVFDYIDSRAEYFIDENLVCIGWAVSSLETSTTIYTNNDPGFEIITGEYFPDGLPDA